MKSLLNKVPVKINFLILTIFISLSSNSQNYFQQKVDYTIHVELDDFRKEINAYLKIIYQNNSPDELKELYFHLWPNAYKDEKTALCKQKVAMGDESLFFAPEEKRGFIDKLDFSVNGKTVRWSLDKEHIDICKIFLDAPIKSGESIEITTPFRVKIPSAEFSRLGFAGSSFYLTQWYPKPAVYDQLGWHPMPYLHFGEFYSEFGSFQVNITLPSDYIVLATGDLVENDKELKWMDDQAELTAKLLSETKKPPLPTNVNVASTKKTLRFFRDSIHDFAWVASNNRYLLKHEFVLPKTGKKINCYSLFPAMWSEEWEKCNLYAQTAIEYFSEKIGEYPYNQYNIVYGNKMGMEYSGMTIIGPIYSEEVLSEVIFHEVGHNWFYGILGFNERKYPFLDEGLTTFYSSIFKNNFTPNLSLDEFGVPFFSKYKGFQKFPYMYSFHLPYLYLASHNMDQHMSLKADEYLLLNYVGIIYYKSVAVFYYLREYMGHKAFDSIMVNFYEHWKFKHPYPQDFETFFKSQSTKDLSWFFNDILVTTKKVDYKISGIRQTQDKYTLSLKNNGKISSPLILGVKTQNRKVDSLIWIEGFTGKKTILFPKDKISSFHIDPEYKILETNRNNNNIRTSGLFKKVEAVKPVFFMSLDDPGKTELYYFPIIGWNNYDKFMAGVAIYSDPVFLRKFDFLFMPMFSTAQTTLTGSYNFGYNIFPASTLFNRIRLGMKGKSYFYDTEKFANRFFKTAPEIMFNFRKKKDSHMVEKYLKYRYVALSNQTNRWNYSEKVFEQKKHQYSVNDVIYLFSNTRSVNPFGYQYNIQANKDMMKIVFEGNYRFSYKWKDKGFDIRLFYGKFIYSKNKDVIDYRFQLNGQNGMNDYLFDDTYFGRTETKGLLSRQFFLKDGAFATATALGQSWDDLLTVNIKSALPGKIPIWLYTDFGAFKGGEGLYYNGGLQLTLFYKSLTIFIPLFSSKQISANQELNGITRIDQKIRFVIHFEKLNLFNLIFDPRNYL